jgi:capsular exopolysaccharide synthesis family protein
MDLPRYLTVIRRRAVLIIAFTAVAAATAFGAIRLFHHPTYEATATLRLSSAASRSGDAIRLDDLAYLDRLMNTYVRIVNSKQFADALGAKLGLHGRPNVKLKLTANTELMLLVARNSNAQAARAIANRGAALLLSEIRSHVGDSDFSEQLARMETDLAAARQRAATLRAQEPAESPLLHAAEEEVQARSQAIQLMVTEFQQTRVSDAVRAGALSVVEPAALPSAPVGERTKLLLAVVLLLGLMGGLGLAFAAERLDTVLHSTRDILRLVRPPLFVGVPSTSGRRLRRRFGLFESYSPEQEAIRRLRTQLATRPHKTIMVTSAMAGEGKTTVVANLAMALAHSGKRVVAVDCDLREPSLHEAFRADNVRGLTPVLWRSSDLASQLQEGPVPNAFVLASGPPASNPTDLLASSSMKALLRELEKQFDAVLLDTPPFAAVADAAALAGVTDGILLVAARGRVRGTALATGLDELRAIDANIAGLVVNRAERDASATDYASRRVVLLSQAGAETDGDGAMAYLPEAAAFDEKAGS